MPNGRLSYITDMNTAYTVCLNGLLRVESFHYKIMNSAKHQREKTVDLNQRPTHEWKQTPIRKNVKAMPACDLLVVGVDI